MIRNVFSQDAKKLKCDFLVVGSGVCGMTLSLLLARGGARVVLLEKSPNIGGSMQCFRRDGILFDTGFHFTTDLSGAFGTMFDFLGMRGSIREIPVDKRIYLSATKKMYHLPQGNCALRDYYISQFPAEREEIIKFFELEEQTYRATPLFSPDAEILPFFQNLLPDTDRIRVTDYLKEHSFSEELRLLLLSFAVCCCGTPVDEISLSSFFRVSYGLHGNLVRFEDGGESFIREFQRQAAGLNLQILPEETIAQCVPDGSERRKCHRIVTSRGREIIFGNGVFTIHPRAIADTIRSLTSNADFFARVEEFEESCGFFSLWGEGPDPETNDVPETKLISYMSKMKIESLISPHDPENTSTSILSAVQTDSNGKKRQAVTVFENVFEQETEQWGGTRSGHRGAAYEEYKREKIRSLERKTYEVRPDLEGHLKILDSASMLTYRDWLSPFGSAYGIRQKTGQFNVFGRLPVRNFYAAGQNALLPGVFGAMQSAFILWRKLAGDEAYSSELKEYHAKKGACK